LAHSVGNGDALVIGASARKTAVQLAAYFTSSGLKAGVTHVWLVSCSSGEGPSDDKIYATKLATAMKATWAGVTVHGPEGPAIADSVDNSPPIVIVDGPSYNSIATLQGALVAIWDINSAASTKLSTMGGNTLAEKAAAVYQLPELTKFYKYFVEVGKAGGKMSGNWFEKKSADCFLETSGDTFETPAHSNPLAKMQLKHQSARALSPTQAV